MKQFVLDHFQSVYCAAANCQQDAEAGDLLIELGGGKLLAMIIINRAIFFNEVKERYDQNTADGVHTLFLIDGRMMPPDRGEAEPSAWMLALHALTNGRVYAYWCEGRAVTIRPLHLGWKWGSDARRVQYGPIVDTSKLMPNWIEATIGPMPGTYASAHFNEGVFWKKQDPQEDAYNYYSWRNYRYDHNRQSQQEAQAANGSAQNEWDPWEDFNRNYGNSEEYSETRQENTRDSYQEARQEQRRQKQRRQQPPRSVRPSPDRAHYALLGVPVGASLEEVKRAYRRKARENHPDLHPDDQREAYTAKMADINTAFEAIYKKFRR